MYYMIISIVFYPIDQMVVNILKQDIGYRWLSMIHRETHTCLTWVELELCPFIEASIKVCHLNKWSIDIPHICLIWVEFDSGATLFSHGSIGWILSLIHLSHTPVKYSVECVNTCVPRWLIDNTSLFCTDYWDRDTFKTLIK